MRWRSASVGLVVVATFAVACGNSNDAQATREEVFANLAHNVAVPGYEDLATATADLQRAMTTLCASPTAANHDAARAAWEDAWDAWNRIRVFRFGPEFAISHVAFPIDPSKIERLVAGAQPSIGPPFTPETLRQAGADVRGLEAIEYVLFTGTLTPVSCSLASASAQLAATTAAELSGAWTDRGGGAVPFAEQLAEPKRSEMYENRQQPLDDIVNGMLLASNEATSALANAIFPTPGRERFTVHTGARIQSTLASVQAAWRGKRAGEPGPGIEALAAAVSPASAERTSETLNKAVQAVNDLPPALSDASPAQLRRAYTYVRELARQLDAEVAPQLNVTINLSDADGDS